MNTILFYESDSKRARETAQKIAEELPKDSYKILPACDMNVDCLKEGDLFLFGLSSCGDDNGRNAEWTRVADLLKGCDLHGKRYSATANVPTAITFAAMPVRYTTYCCKPVRLPPNKSTTRPNTRKNFREW